MKFRKSFSALLVSGFLLFSTVCSTVYGYENTSNLILEASAGITRDNAGYENVTPKAMPTPAGDVTVTPAPTPTPVGDIYEIIDNSSTGYIEKGKWLTADGGVNTTYRYTTKLGSYALWRYKVPEDGYYDIIPMLESGCNDAIVKYTIFDNDEVLNSYYIDQMSSNRTLRKQFEQYHKYSKDNWITVRVKCVAGKCVADAMSFRRLTSLPEVPPTPKSGASRPFTVGYFDSSNSSGVIYEKDGNYTSSWDDGDYVTVGTSRLSGIHYDPAYIFSVNAAVAGADDKNKLELRLGSPDGLLLGDFELKSTEDQSLKFCEQTFMSKIDGSISVTHRNEKVYIIFRGDGNCYIESFRFSSPIQRDWGEGFELNPAKNKICGYVKPGFNTNNPVMNAGFRVEITGAGVGAVTNLFSLSDSNGYFEIPVNSSDPVSIKISKSGYLCRELSGITFINNTAQAATQNKPIEIWPGDIMRDGVQDGAINLQDIMEVAKSFNTARGDLLYSSEGDINKDGVINLSDIVLIANHFNKTTSSYEKEM